ncbi:MAG: hypothetical protein ACD_33C00036G0005 [uncultured bacterium]|nr:MAG: hypothetical protein ACD_33C00036G0005 [uncultured bacterium]
MFDDEEFNSYTPPPAVEEKKPYTAFKKFPSKKEVVTDIPYIPITVYVDKEFPQEAKDGLYSIIVKLLSKDYKVRVNGDDKEFYERIKTLADESLEIYTPWKEFNDIETKHYFNSETCKLIAQKHFASWDKIPNPVKSLLARNIRMLFGDKNNSLSLCLITWSKDGASKLLEITKETGRSSFIIKVASTYGIPVLNIGKPNAENVLQRTFGIS